MNPLLVTAMAALLLGTTARMSAAEWETKTEIPVGRRTYITAYGGVSRGAEPGIDKVRMMIKRTLAIGGRLFARLNAER